MSSGPLPAPGRTGVRITGDHYQWLIAWEGCLAALHDASRGAPNPVVAVGVETDSGNLDDVVLYRAQPPHTYMQVKYAVDSSTPVNTDWLIAPSKSSGPSILRKIASTWKDLSADGGPVDLRIVTNRAPDPADVLIAGRDARTKLLLPRASTQGPSSQRGQARAAWATAADLDPIHLLQLLEVLVFDTSRELQGVLEVITLKMLALGLRGDDAAVAAAADWVAAQVRSGYRRLEVGTIQQAVEDMGLHAGPARAVLSVATLKPDPIAEDAAHALDWVDRFEGADAYSKRRPLSPATWQQLQQDINAIPSHLVGVSGVLLTGSLRQATAFAVGASLRMVSGIDVAVVQRGQSWASEDRYDAPITPAMTPCEIGNGPDLAVAIEVATTIGKDVATYIREIDLPVGRLMILSPPDGPRDDSVSGASAANALAVGVRDKVRRAVKGHRRVHLFLAGPMGLSLLLGHRWNRIAPTTAYEDLGATLGYEPAFTISA